MQLDAPFIRLPLRFDVQFVLEQLAAVSEVDWQPHPQGYIGNSSLPLVSSEGLINDDLNGAMRPTPHLCALTALHPILAAVPTLIGRSRLMRVEPQAQVQSHTDVHSYWENRLRIHIPLVTNPGTRFYCDGVGIHMRPGEAWVFDNNRIHWVKNHGQENRIHLVVDTLGSPEFWQMFELGQRVATEDEWAVLPALPEPIACVETDDLALDDLDFETFNQWAVMPPGEVAQTLRQAIDACPEARDACEEPLQRLLRDWRYQWGLHADANEGRAAFFELRRRFRLAALSQVSDEWCCEGGAKFETVLRGRLGGLLNVDAPAIVAGAKAAPAGDHRVGIDRAVQFDRPIFVLAAPRSGSTLLFETLARHRRLFTVGGEGHGLFESEIGLPIEHFGYASNRMLADDATPEVAERLQQAIGERLRGSRGQPWETAFQEEKPRLLEKTPKNVLRLPFLKKVFPDALFVVLYREPAPSVASMMEAWESGRFVTYPRLPGWSGLPWSLLLVPEWQELDGQSLAVIASEQWRRANAVLLDDLSTLDPSEYLLVRYGDFVTRPYQELQRICAFADLIFGNRMRMITARSLELSRYTLTPPRPDKWRDREEEVMPVIGPEVKAVWQRLEALHQQSVANVPPTEL